MIVMTFGNKEDPSGDCVMGHVPFRDLLAAVKAKDPEFDPEMLPVSRLRYDFALFGNDESVVFNVPPTTPGAKPVTVVYYDTVPEQA